MGVYTKSGDDGTTSLIGGSRVSKCSDRLEAYGSLDELTAFVAHLRDLIIVRGVDQKLGDESDRLLKILDRLMVVQVYFAAEEDVAKSLPQISSEDVEELERAIDGMSAILPKLTKFTLPCGDPLLSMAHICRTVCRRCERVAVKVASESAIAPEPLKYINRLSDYLYVLSRLLTKVCDIEEILWLPHCE